MKQAEEIILSKKYFELSDSERALVKELASNEEEYESMRWFLMGMNEEFSAQKIEPSNSLREGVMAHLKQKQPAPKGIWLNGVSAFLFPEGKKFYQYPALQIAAVAVLFVSIIAIYNNKTTFDNSLAVNDNIETPLEENNEGALNEAPLEDLENISSAEKENGNNLEQLAQEQSPTQTISASEQLDDAVDADEYKEMSVADEVKLMEDLNYRDNSMRSELTQNYSGVDALSTNAPVTTGAVDKKTEELKRDDKQKQTNKERNTGLSKDQKTTSSSDAPGYATTTTKNENLSEPEMAPTEEEKSEMVNTTAGGVYGNTLDDSTNKPDADQESSKKVNLNDTKILKKLIFVVK